MARNRHLYIVEYWRGLAALAVAWFHMTNTYQPSWVQTSGSYGWLGVEAFFVISGFIIPYSLSALKEDYSFRAFPRFMIRRLTRLEPPYLASITLALILWNLSTLAPNCQGSAPSNDISQIGAHLLYLVPLTGHEWLQPVYWTLAWEFAFYISVGLLYPLVGRRRAENRLAVLLLSLVGLAYVDLVSSLTALFIIGVSAQKIFESLWWRVDEPASARHRTGAMFIVLLVMSTCVLASRNSEMALVGATVALLIIALPTLELTGSLHRALGWLGAVSYSLYLVHVPVGGRVVNIGKRFVSEPWQEFLVSLAALFCSMVIAALFHKWIERPAVNWSRKFRAPAQRETAPARASSAPD